MTQASRLNIHLVLQTGGILFAKVWVKRKIERKHHGIDLTVKPCSNNYNIRKIFIVAPFINEAGTIVYLLLLAFHA